MNGLSLDGDSAFATGEDLLGTSSASGEAVEDAFREVAPMTPAPRRTIRLLEDSPEGFGDLVGSSPLMRDLYAQLECAARTEVGLLITGEAGTGKTLVARSVHAASSRQRGPFVSFECGGVPSPLVHSELFGLQRGAFEGIDASRPGLLEQAHGGTLFLNQVGDLPRPVQGELLSVLKSRRVQRLGAKTSTPVDIRIVCATTRDLRAEVHRDLFREDLYLQVAAMRASVPPLRERMGDLPQLIDHFLGRHRANSSDVDLPERVVKVFEAYHWPGNVRELESAVAHLAESFELQPALLDPAFENQVPAVALDAPVVPLRVARRAAAKQFEHQYLASVLAKAGGNVTRAAAMAAVSRQMIQRMLRKHGL